MFSLFKKEKENKNDKSHLSLISVAALLIHSAKIDQNFTEKEKDIIKKALIEMGADNNNLDEILKDAEIKEQDSNQILEFTKEVKNKNIDEKKIVIEALWNIIYSDKDADIYETNLMRRLSGLLYLDPKVVGDIKEKIKSKQ
ncbi:TerB family tellurite resistance protein [Candidatus Pelagibacter sp.]|nr:TerB family tellurite resistance protein [Candidatus Pelagibacter sp.]